jgi:acetolactate synthase I/II/III large subunit
MKVSDYVMQFLAEKGVENIFLVSGGGIMHMLDSVGRHPRITFYCNNHEQACAVSAEGYARVTGKPGICLATVGPGASNALSGVLSAWTDSIPMMVLVGQVRQDLIADYSKLRQFGPQEANTLEMARPVTKYAVSIRDPKKVRYELERAWHEATCGRPGPVWVEFPLDVQGSEVSEHELVGFEPPPAGSSTQLSAQVKDVLAALRAAERPIFVAGNGIRLAHAQELLRTILDRTWVCSVRPASAARILPSRIATA